MKNYAKLYHFTATAKEFTAYKNRVKTKKERAYLRELSKIERLEKNGKITLNSYGDILTDELVSALLCAFCAQKYKQPEKECFWRYKIYELLQNNAKGELHNEFIGRACIKLYDFDEKERLENIHLYARKAANHAVYKFKYAEDGKSLSSKNDDYAKIAKSDDNTIIALAYPHYAEELKKAFLSVRIAKLSTKQAYCLTFWLNNAVLFDTLEDIYNFGTDEKGEKIRFFKNFESFERTFYRARKALKDNALMEDNIDELVSMLYENKTYNAVILSEKYEKAKKESEAREKARTESGKVYTYKVG